MSTTPESMSDRFSYRFDRYLVEPHTASLLRDGEPVALEPKAFQILLLLLEHRDRLVDKQELLDAVWPEVVVTENAVTRAVARLRKALEDDPRQPCFIATVHARGYRFVAPAERVSSAEEPFLPPDADLAELDSGPVDWPQAPPEERSLHRRRRLPALLVGAAILVVIAAYVADGTFRSGSRSGRAASSTAETGDETLDPRRVAVLPMVDLSGSGDSEHVVDGFTEQLISVLSRVDGVRTVPRTSVMAYKGSNRRVSEIGHELGAGLVFEGSLARDGDRLRITVRLIDVRSEENLWSKEFNGSLIDFFDIQSEVAMRIGEILHAELSSEKLRVIAERPTGEITAYEKYLRGRAYYREVNRVANEKAIECYLTALELDPDFARAWAALANAYGERLLRFGFDPEEGRDQAIDAAQRALELDGNLPEAYLALGVVDAHDSRMRSALDHVLRALELEPEYEEAIFYASLFSYTLGSLDDAFLLSLRDHSLSSERRADYAMRLWEFGFDELAQELVDDILEREPLHLRLGSYLAVRDILEGNLEAARARVGRLTQAYQTSELLWRVAGDVEWRSGHENEALEYYERAVAVEGTVTDASLRVAKIRYERGELEQAEAILNGMTAYATNELERGSEWSQDRFILAAVEAIRGNVDEAVDWYAQAVDAGRRNFYWDEEDPLFASLHGDARFVAELERMRSDVAAMKERVVRELGPDMKSVVLRAWTGTR